MYPGMQAQMQMPVWSPNSVRCPECGQFLINDPNSEHMDDISCNKCDRATNKVLSCRPCDYDLCLECTR
jgi:hypothetical protein